jgi:hypothetical protein
VAGEGGASTESRVPRSGVLRKEAATVAAIREARSEKTLRGTYLFAHHGVDITGKTFAGVGYEVSPTS